MSPEAVLIKNIHSGEAPHQHPMEIRLTATRGNQIFTVLDDRMHGEELWVSDGTAAGTHLVKDVRPGILGAGITAVTVSGNQVFFTADDGVHGRELWVTDGSEAGTRMLADVFNPPTNSYGNTPLSITPFLKGVTFFARRQWGAFGLWFTDGTESGTLELVSSFFWNASYALEIPCMEAGGKFYFNPEGLGGSLWVTDGTVAGTHHLTDDETGGTSPVFLAPLGKSLLFSGSDDETGQELYKSNGTAKGTVLVKDLVPGTDSSMPMAMVQAGKKNYFLADHEGGISVMVTDGTEGGTRPVTVPEEMRGGGGAQTLALMGNVLLVPYLSHSGDGTLVGIDIRNHTCQLLLETEGISSYGQINSLVTTGTGTASRAYFTLLSGERRMLWVTDGTPAGTRPAAPRFSPEGEATCSLALAAAGSQVFFTASLPGQASTLWVSNGTEAGTRPVTEALVPTDADSFPQFLTPVGARLYFTAEDGEHGRELWFTDGPESSAQLVMDLRPGSLGSEPRDLVVREDILYFSAEDGSSGRELWRTDGTEAGTWVVKDIYPDSTGSEVSALHLFDDRLYFQATSPETGRALWISDGTEEGTVLLANLAEDTEGVKNASASLFTEHDGWLYFAVESDNAPDVRGIYRTDGTLENTTKLTSASHIETLFLRAPVSNTYGNIYPTETLLYFSTYEGGVRTIKYARLGQVAVSLHDFNGVGLAPPYRLSETSLRYQAGSDTYGLALASGARYSISTSPYETFLVRLNSQKADYLKSSNRELWLYHSNSPHVRLLISDVPLDPEIHLLVDGTLIFAQIHSDQTRSLWLTRGTVASTRRLSGLLYTETPRQDGQIMQRAGDALYFPAQSPAYGVELHGLSLVGRLEIIDVTQAESPMLLPDEATVDFGVAPLARTLRLRNAGLQDLPALALSLSEAEAPFTLSTTTVSSLAPGAESTVTLTFTGSTSGTHTTTLSLTDATEPAPAQPLQQSLTLTARRMEPGEAPVVWAQPASQIVLAGSEVSFQASLAYQGNLEHPAHWHEEGGPNEVIPTGGPIITGAGGTPQASDEPISSSTTLRVKAEKAARYQARLSSAASEHACLAIVKPAPQQSCGLIGQTVRLTCEATAPPGCTLSYQWYNYGDQPLASIDRIRGSRSATLEIHNLQVSDLTSYYSNGYYCVVTLHAPDRTVSLSNGITSLNILYPPQIQIPGYLNNFVGEEVSLQLHTNYPADRFTVKGLPPGLTMSASGLITGKPTKALPFSPTYGMAAPYRVTVSARNAAGVSEALTLTWLILPLWNPGSYDGLFERNGALDDGKGLGSRMQLTITSAGSISGQLQHEGKTYRFSTYHLTHLNSYTDSFDAEFPISLGKGKPPLTLIIPQGGGYQSMEATLELAEGTSAAGILYRTRATDLRYTLPPPYAYKKGTLRLTSQARQETDIVPQGQGYLSLSISGKGIAVWKGKLADGTALSGSANLTLTGPGDDGPSLALRQELYKGRASLLGWIVMGFPYDGALDFSGTLTWFKPAQPSTSKDRLYQDGIPLHDLQLMGGSYTPPARGEMLFGLTANEPGDTTPNLTFTASGSNLPDATFQQDLLLSAGHKIKLSPLSPDTPLRSLSFNPKTGTFKGSFTLLHESDKKLHRTATLEGILPNQMSDQASGFFLLPDLPEAEGETLKNTAIQSGKVEITLPEG